MLCAWTVFSPTENQQTEALTQIELKPLTVFSLSLLVSASNKRISASQHLQTSKSECFCSQGRRRLNVRFIFVALF